jgi:hypothetical protein
MVSMPVYSSRGHAFLPSEAVRASRERTQYVGCSVCEEPRAAYLFFRGGVRFVRCLDCGLVYVSPVGRAGPSYFDIALASPAWSSHDRSLAVADLSRMLVRLADQFASRRGRLPRRTLLLGRFLEELPALPELRRIGLTLVRIEGPAFERLSEDGDVPAAAGQLAGDADLVVLNELLEACSRPGHVLGQIAPQLAGGAELAIAYADAESLPARLLRRHWPALLESKRAFFGLSQLTRLAARHGLSLVKQEPVSVHRTPRYVYERMVAGSSRTWLKRAVPTRPGVELLTGLRVATFEHGTAPELAPPEKLSIILPVYDEAHSIQRVVDTLLKKPLRIEKELVIVESGSKDGTRDIVRQWQGLPGIRVLLQPVANGKGNAVRAGLQACTGSIVLIQDADLEYDIDDYDALLEPILQGKTSFVLGSRTLGASGWKVRQFATGAIAGTLLNLAQVGFAKTFNLLYQQRTTDVNTMFKVFRRSCLSGIELESDGFELDIELVCKLVVAGHAPLEVPVNYVARDFQQGKKIRFFRDAWPSYAAFFKYRWQR